MSERIRKMYRKKGLKPPDGKGIHTAKFHEMATSIMRDNPGYSKSRAYSIAMGKLGRDKAVKKSHWGNKKKYAKALKRKKKKVA